MELMIGIALVLGASAAPIRAWLNGYACLTRALRCDPNNPSFKPPRLPGARPPK